MLGAIVLASACGRAPQQSATDSEMPKSANAADETAPEDWDVFVQLVREQDENAIRFRSRPVSKEEFRMLLEGCDGLMVLEIDQSAISSELIHQVLTKLPGLRQLRFDGPVVESDLKWIASNLPELTVLNLPQGEFGNEGVQALSEHSKLELLRIGAPNVNNDGVRAILEIPNLRFLHLINVSIDDQVLKDIAKKNSLESFYLDGGGCSEEGLSELVKASPQLHFHWNQLHLNNDPHSHPH
ncbi:hypothetical protein KOR42_32480 [Thalassoglobus neptunius]|uniref:Leucine Rich repeats (2 copies) n=2 Tax=Thalassoglobus neptunius TaxID=1938619 RepID=A0A5C5WP06_9PLAN|nr:hypothetical protein KOR42_32480 [Thalassoglobus neptunius]